MRDEKGLALILALFITVILTSAVALMLEAMWTDLRIAGNLHKELKAFYIAEAGIETALKELKADPTWSEGFDEVEFPPGSDGKFSVTVSRSGSTVEITSIGEIDGAVKQLTIVLRAR